tara:strand:- start:6108 stop:6980 length:873 start_codon:yes stop_codon:yes gene_type:complete
MAFNHLKKLNELERLPKQEQSIQSESKAGLGSRQRTQQMLSQGQEKITDMKIGMDDASRGVQRIFARNTIRPEEDSMSPWMELFSTEEERIAKEAKDKLDEDYDPLKLTEDLYGKKGGKDREPVEQSYFNTELIEGGLRGNSRKSGDASIEVQQTVVNKIIEVGSKMGMTDYEIAYTLAIARAESGFNPDAASTDSSASGVGQFIDDTGSKYGITNENRWNVDIQVQALVDHTLDNFETARNKGYGNEYVYALHHDGIGLGGKGLSLSKKNVMPFVPKYLKAIKNYRGES